MKCGLVGFKPEMPTNMRTIRFAEEVWTPTGIVDFIFLKQEHPVEIEDLGGVIHPETNSYRVKKESFSEKHLTN